MSSGRPPAAIAIVRISGPAAFSLAQQLAGPLPPARRASLRALRAADGSLLDRALVLRFEAESSATGEDLVEFHCHGGRAVVAAVEKALLADERARAALPGEFTRRALENGRIDLAQARGLADLLEAETETQRRHAIAASDGHLSRMVSGWIDRLVAMAADVEAAIDHAEEGDLLVRAPSMASVMSRCRELTSEIEVVLAAPPVERWRDGIRVVLAGPPNAGKSTLLNLLAGRDAAIVSPLAGTTRDQIDVSVQRGGVAYVLSDTAGLHDDTNDIIERLGMDKARAAVSAADLVLWLGDEAPPYVGAVHVHARGDVSGREARPAGTVATSALDPRTISELWDVIAERTKTNSLPVVGLHMAERETCLQCVEALRCCETESDEDLVAEALRAGVEALAGILGGNATEMMLDQLFSRFCIGK